MKCPIATKEYCKFVCANENLNKSAYKVVTALSVIQQLSTMCHVTKCTASFHFIDPTFRLRLQYANLTSSLTISLGGKQIYTNVKSRNQRCRSLTSSTTVQNYPHQRGLFISYGPEQIQIALDRNYHDINFLQGKLIYRGQLKGAHIINQLPLGANKHLHSRNHWRASSGTYLVI